MSGHYQQKTVKDLYPAKDVLFAVVGVICAIIVGVGAARLFTGWAGI
jgi:hypothetical protein